MQPRDDANDDDPCPPVDGLEVEETKDEDTIRRFVADWRRRVSQEYARSLLRECMQGSRHPPSH